MPASTEHPLTMTRIKRISPLHNRVRRLAPLTIRVWRSRNILLVGGVLLLQTDAQGTVVSVGRSSDNAVVKEYHLLTVRGRRVWDAAFFNLDDAWVRRQTRGCGGVGS